jgi:hypothetical protein
MVMMRGPFSQSWNSDTEGRDGVRRQPEGLIRRQAGDEGVENQHRGVPVDVSDASDP